MAGGLELGTKPGCSAAPTLLPFWFLRDELYLQPGLVKRVQSEQENGQQFWSFSLLGWLGCVSLETVPGPGRKQQDEQEGG